MRYIGGIDPGLNGALTILDFQKCEMHIWDTPTVTVRVGDKNRKRCDPDAFCDALDMVTLDSVAIEKVHAMPNDGAVGAFTFGKTTGIAIGILAAYQIPWVETTPAKWKQDLRVPADKNAARHRASQLFPLCEHGWRREMDDGRAESALIALHHAISIDVLADNPFTLASINGAPPKKPRK